MKRLGTSLFATALAAILGLGHVGAASAQDLAAAADQEGKLVLYADGPTAVVEAMVSAFETEYPGIDVEFYRGDTGQVMQRFETESAAGTHMADVVTTTDRQSKILTAKGYTAPHTVPNKAKFPENLHAPNDAWNNYGLVTLGIAWNTEEVAEADVPKTWNDLLDPKWAGKLGMQDPLQGGGAAIWFATMLQVWGEENWADYMQKLGAQKLRYARYAEVMEMLAAGEISVQLIAYPSFVQPLINDGAPIAWTHLDPSLFTGQSLNLSANAKNPNAAKLYIDFVMSDAGQDVLATMNQVPTMPEKLPAVFAPIGEANLLPQAHELERDRFDFFQERIKEYMTR